MGLSSGRPRRRTDLDCSKRTVRPSCQAAEEVAEGKLDEHFPLDIFQTGSARAQTQRERGDSNRAVSWRENPLARVTVHPNDHVTWASEQRRDPSAIHISAAEQLKNCLIPALEGLHGALDVKANEFWGIIKIGRTHLMDATPVRLGQEFSGYAWQVSNARERARRAISVLEELALGGTAVGTGLNRHMEFPGKVMQHLEQRTGIQFHEAQKHFEAQAQKTRWEASGHLNDRGWLSRSRTTFAGSAAAPRCGIGEIDVPYTRRAVRSCRAKSSGHVRIAHDGLRSGHRQRQLRDLVGRERKLRVDVMMPVMAHNLLEAFGSWVTRATPSAKMRARSRRTRSVAVSLSSCRWRW